MKKLTIVLLCLVSQVAIAQTAGDFYKKAVVKFKLKDYGGAIVEYTRAIELRDSSAVLYNNRGVCKYKMELYSDAIEDYSKALSNNPNYVNAHFNKGNSHLGLSELEDALISYDKAIEIDSSYYKAYINRSKVFYLMRDYTSSIKDLTKVIVNNTGSNKQNLFLERGNAYFQLDKFQEALIDYNTSISLNPNYYKGLINRGQCHLNLTNNKSAMNDFTLAMRLDGTRGEAYYFRGLAYLDQTNSVKAANKEKKTLMGIFQNKKLMELACSDFEKAKSFGYGSSYEVIQTYCR
jgi:tetratricopeptide (TPR) repeat protein